MKIIIALIAYLLAVSPVFAQTPPVVQPGRPIPVRPQVGVPLTNPDGSRPRSIGRPNVFNDRNYKLPVIAPFFIFQGPQVGYIVRPQMYGLPFAPAGYIWKRYYSNALLIDLRTNDIVQVRQRWFR